MSSGLETLIISGILHVPDYQVKVFPYIKKDIFAEQDAATIFDLSKKYFDKYNKIPTHDALDIELQNTKGLSEKTFQDTKKLIDKVYSDPVVKGVKNQDLSWMINTTENYVVNRACQNAVYEAHAIVTGENKKIKREAIPDILKEAISISFDTDIGHDYIDDSMKRYDFYHNVQSRIPFPLTMLNHVTKGGCPRKSMVVPVAPTGVGKSLFLTDWSAYLLSEGYNVLYITLEMAEERIAERIDAKLMNVTIDDLYNLPRSMFENKINVLKKKKLGKIIIKEYPTGSFNANHLQHLLQELSSKKGFKPDVIMVDYLNLVASYRIGMSSGSYGYIKAVAEELRSVAMQQNCIICAPTQTNRNGQNSTDFELNEVSESHGISMTADMMFGFISTPELEQLGHMRIKQLKNRFGNLFAPNSFLVGVHRAKMTLFDVDMPSQGPQNTAPPRAAQSNNTSNTIPKSDDSVDLLKKPEKPKGKLTF